MIKLFSLVIVLVGYATLATCQSPDYSLQKLGRVVQPMANALLCGYNCVPNFWNDTTNCYVSFSTSITNGDAPSDVYNCMINYMINATGDATSTYTTGTGSSFVLTYTGDYNPYMPAPGPLDGLATVLKGFTAPDLGGHICGQHVFSKSKRLDLHRNNDSSQFHNNLRWGWR